jgi:uncharacterized repeat protein (TIGR01451 family)
MTRTKIWLKIFSLIAIFSLLVYGPAHADEAPGSEEKPAELQGNSADQAKEPIYLYLAAGAFDPLQGLPSLPPQLAYSTDEAAAAGAYIVQLSGPVHEAWKGALEQAGAQLGGYLPDYAFVVGMTVEAKAQVEALPFVRWVGVYEPAYRLSPSIDGSETRSYRILTAPWADLNTLQGTINTIDSRSRAFDGGFVAVLNGEQVNEMARQPGVVWIEPLVLQQLYNDVGGGTIMGGTTAWSNGYTGSGVVIAVTDTGLDTGDKNNIHQDFAGRVSQISSWPVQYVNYGSGCETSNDGDDDGAADTQSGHGSHVTGSFAGDGTRSSGQFKGLAYDATITFQAVEQYTTWVSPNPFYCPNGYYLTGIPDDVRDLLTQVYGWGARVQNNSWGGGDHGVYDTQSSNFDDFVFNNQDMTVVVAAGNDGTDADANGYVDENSVSSPGTSKNLIVIGASDNERNSGGISTYTWGQAWSSDYPANPTKDDYTSDSRQELAAFSSRGPMEDGRIKPDVVAPGTNILSVRSSEASEDGWGPYDNYYMYMGGTSMASPLSAGAAALVRDYYITTEGWANPSAALIKATLINTAVDITGYNNTSQEAGKPIPNNHEGWGLINVAAATTAGRAFVEETSGIGTGTTRTYNYYVNSGEPFKVSLVWSDYSGNPAAGKALVNDLNLRVTAPDGSTKYWGNVFSGGWSQTGGSADTVNNVENVYIQNPASGTWKVEVIGNNIPSGPQTFALVADGNLTLFEPFQVTDFTPGMAYNNAILQDADISGSGFEAGATVTLVRGAESINGANVIVDTDNDIITADFNLNGATVGWWDVRVDNPSESATLEDALLVLDSTKPDLVISKTAEDTQIDPGTLLTYTITIENAGVISGTAIEFTDTLPEGVTFESLTPNCTTFTNLPDGFSCEILPPTLDPGESIVYTLVVNVLEDTQGTITNIVEVSSAEGDAYPADNQDQVSVMVGTVRLYLPVVFKNLVNQSEEPNPIQNGDFENGQDGSWIEDSSNGYDLIVEGFAPTAVVPHSGDWGVWLGGANWEISSLTQDVTVPSGNPTLTYWIYLASQESTCSGDIGKVMVNGSNLESFYLCTSTNTGGWVQHSFDLSTFAGMNVTIEFYASLNGANNSNFFLDDVAIE